jgi:hypothetical protein
MENYLKLLKVNIPIFIGKYLNQVDIEISISLKKIIKLFKIIFILTNLENLVWWFIFNIDERSSTIDEYCYIEQIFINELKSKFGSNILIYKLNGNYFIKNIQIKFFN